MNLSHCEAWKKQKFSNCFVPERQSQHSVWNSSLGDCRLDTRPERKYSVSLIFKTLVNRRCEFSAPINERPAHKFSVKINLVHIEKNSYNNGGDSLISDALIETRQQHHITLFWWLHGFHQSKEIPEWSSECKISFSRKTKLAHNTSFFFTGLIPNWNYSFSSTCYGPLGSKVHIGPGCHSCILHTSSLPSSHMAGLGKHLGIFGSPSR